MWDSVAVVHEDTPPLIARNGRQIQWDSIGNLAQNSLNIPGVLHTMDDELQQTEHSLNQGISEI